MVNYNENAIREAAYYIWQNAGCHKGGSEKNSGRWRLNG